ncbi:MAG: hypothetical protein ACE5G9_08725 [Nitrospinales bacterium]
MEEQVQEKKKFITPKSVIHFIIALIAMTAYFVFIDWGLMKVQGLDFYYLWNVGGDAAGH